MSLFNKFRNKEAWMIEVTNISEIADYFYSRSKAELVCNAANQYTASTNIDETIRRLLLLIVFFIVSSFRFVERFGGWNDEIITKIKNKNNFFPKHMPPIINIFLSEKIYKVYSLFFSEKKARYKSIPLLKYYNNQSHYPLIGSPAVVANRFIDILVLQHFTKLKC